MTWTCSYCGKENEDGEDRCEWCGNYADWTFEAITDRIGKAARAGDGDAVLNECLVLKYRLRQELYNCQMAKWYRAFRSRVMRNL